MRHNSLSLAELGIDPRQVIQRGLVQRISGQEEITCSVFHIFLSPVMRDGKELKQPFIQTIIRCRFSLYVLGYSLHDRSGKTLVSKAEKK
jgi:hypothetical protein